MQKYEKRFKTNLYRVKYVSLQFKRSNGKGGMG